MGSTLPSEAATSFWNSLNCNGLGLGASTGSLGFLSLCFDSGAFSLTVAFSLAIAAGCPFSGTGTGGGAVDCSSPGLTPKGAPSWRTSPPCAAGSWAAAQSVRASSAAITRVSRPIVSLTPAHISPRACVFSLCSDQWFNVALQNSFTVCTLGPLRPCCGGHHHCRPPAPGAGHSARTARRRGPASVCRQSRRCQTARAACYAHLPLPPVRVWQSPAPARR